MNKYSEIPVGDPQEAGTELKRYLITVEVDNCEDEKVAFMAARDLLTMQINGELRQIAKIESMCADCYEPMKLCHCNEENQ